MDKHDVGLVNSCPGCVPNNHPVGVVYYDKGKFWIQDDRYIPVEFPQFNFDVHDTTLGGQDPNKLR